ncbi:hypothetical protein AB0I82_23230 [Streptomyces sp. NPDC050315]|uniref:hypothetical protein n=1 Tax=Streptomyces sp. NPDC050315 TaxID=3155039 RepID=UPI003420914F
MDRPDFPHDLLEVQTAWYLTYGRLATAPTNQVAPYRRRLLELSRRIADHPYWQTPQGTPAARVALKEQARAAAVRGRRP